MYLFMGNLVRERLLPNGLTVSFYDQTRRYFGDFYLVTLEIVCKVPVIADYFGENGEFSTAKSLLGDEVVYRRTVEQMGVPSTEIERAVNRLMADFETHSLPYFAAPAFPQKLVCAELKKHAKKPLHLSMTRVHT